MPTVLVVRGWRLFFYSDEGTEPIHIHARKAEMECKYWLRPDSYEIDEEFAFRMAPQARREIREIIFKNFDLLIEAWQNQAMKKGKHSGEIDNADD